MSRARAAFDAAFNVPRDPRSSAYRAPRPTRHRLSRHRLARMLSEATVALIPLLALALIGWAKSQGWMP
jgi:hypothetical protein